MLLREHRFRLIVGTETHLLKIEEMVKGLALWPNKFRLRVPASSRWEAKTFYGASCYEAAEMAAEFMAAAAGRAEISKTSALPQRKQASPPRALMIQETD